MDTVFDEMFFLLLDIILQVKRTKMQKDLMDSIKARLYDFKYTPFLSSYIFSWLYVNSKLVLIFFSSKLKVEEKIAMLAWDDVNYWIPLGIAVLYVMIFPAFTLGFYWVTLKYKKIMAEIQVNIEDETKITQAQAKELRNKYRDIEVELNEAFTELETAKVRYEDKNSKLAQSYIVKEDGLEEQKKDAVNEAIKPIQQKLNKAISDLQVAIDEKALIEDEKDKELGKVRAELATALVESVKKVDVQNDSSPFGIITDIKVEDENLMNSDKKLSNGLQDMVDKSRADEIEKINKLAANLSNVQKNILQIFNDNDTFMMIDRIKTIALDKYKINKPMIDLRLKELKGKEILELSSNSVTLKDNGLKVIELIFNQKH